MIFGNKKEKKYFATITSTKVFQKRFKFFFCWKQTSNAVKDQKIQIRSKINEKHSKLLRIAFQNRQDQKECGDK